MVYFQISRVGFDCGLEKDSCKDYPSYCSECVIKHLEKFSLDVNQNIKVTLIDSEEKRIQMIQDLIWQKFLDVLNIKHIVLTAKKSGLLVIDYPVSGAGIDLQLLTGFIQANVSFSESSNVQSDSTSHQQDLQYYEFQYHNFSILLKNGEFLRICLVLDQNASDSLKLLVSEVLNEYEARYLDKISALIRKGRVNFKSTRDFIIEMFNIKLVFPVE